MKEKTYRIVHPAIAAVIAALLAALAIACGMALYARMLLQDTLDGRKTEVREEQVTHFSLHEQMMKSQADTRVRGWLTIAQREEVSVKTERGTLRASFFEPVSRRQDTPWAIVLHGGLGTDRMQVMDIACALSLKGYAVLAPDLYAHGASDGRISSLGLADARDVEAWIGWILNRDERAKIVLFGQDEGGAAVLIAASKGLPEQVRAAAVDSVYANVKDHMLNILDRNNKTAGFFQGWLLSAAYRMAHGMNAEQGMIWYWLSGCELPLLIIHGTGDSEVPAWHGEDLAAAGNNAQLILAEGAGHGMARYAMGEAWYDKLILFYDQAM